MKSARNEFARIISSQKLNRALRKNPPPSTDYDISPVNMVYVYRERFKQWTGPHIVISNDRK